MWLCKCCENEVIEESVFELDKHFNKTQLRRSYRCTYHECGELMDVNEGLISEIARWDDEDDDNNNAGLILEISL